jgi:hypothetical protein
MSKIQSSTYYSVSNRKKRKGVHSKTKTSKLKTSKLYKKKNRGQGR